MKYLAKTRVVFQATTDAKTYPIKLPPSLLDDDGWSSVGGGVPVDGVGGGGGEMSREELLQLYVMKLDEEANYFKATSPVEEEFCNCPKCQVGCVKLTLAARGSPNQTTLTWNDWKCFKGLL